MQELFKGRVNFHQLKRALACRGNSRAGSSQGNTVYIFCILYNYISQPLENVFIFCANIEQFGRAKFSSLSMQHKYSIQLTHARHTMHCICLVDNSNHVSEEASIYLHYKESFRILNHSWHKAVFLGTWFLPYTSMALEKLD